MRRSLCAIIFGILAIVVTGCGGGGGSNAQSALPAITANQPGAVSPAATHITEFPIAAGDSGPSAIAVANDGNPWFLSSAAVNRMTPKGAITQFTQSRFGSYNSGTDIISGPDGALWFTANCIENEGAVGPCFVTQQVLLVRSTTAGAFSIFASAGDTLKGTFQSGLVFASSTSIAETVGLGETRGSNGSAYQLTRTDGTVVVPATALPIGCPDFFPGLFYTAGGIAIGSDNAAYISASSPCGDLDAPNGEAESVVLRLSLSGAVMNTFKVPNAQRIVKGVDGNLWVTQNGAANSIGRLTPSGTLTEFPLPTSRAGPLGITLGNDGAVWFTEFDANKIGRITTDGTITEFPIPTPNAKPVGIASLAGECGPGHGDIWFTEFNANKIGRLLF